MVFHEIELPHTLHREETGRFRLVTFLGKVLILKGEEVGVARLTVHLVHLRILPHGCLLSIGRSHNKTGK